MITPFLLLALHLPAVAGANSSNDAQLYRRIRIPEPFLTRENGHTFGGDIRIGDLNGDGRCDFLVYRSNHSGPSGPAIGGFKPAFLGAFDMDGTNLWSVGGGGTHPVRPGSVAIHDLHGDGAAEVICFWHQPKDKVKADWQSLADIVVQISFNGCQKSCAIKTGMGICSSLARQHLT